MEIGEIFSQVPNLFAQGRIFPPTNKKKRELVLFSLSWSQSEQHPLMHPVGWIVYGHETRLDGWMVCEQKTIVS